jgi:hypothetical protein
MTICSAAIGPTSPACNQSPTDPLQASNTANKGRRSPHSAAACGGPSSTAMAWANRFIACSPATVSP